MLIINGRAQFELPATRSVKREVETAALDMEPEKEKPKRKPTHGVETRNRTSD